MIADSDRVVRPTSEPWGHRLRISRFFSLKNLMGNLLFADVPISTNEINGEMMLMSISLNVYGGLVNGMEIGGRCGLTIHQKISPTCEKLVKRNNTLFIFCHIARKYRYLL